MPWDFSFLIKKSVAWNYWDVSTLTPDSSAKFFLLVFFDQQSRDAANSHDFKARRAGIIAGWRRHSAGVITNVTWPCLANCERALADRHAASAAGQDCGAASIPPEAETHKELMNPFWIGGGTSLKSQLKFEVQLPFHIKMTTRILHCHTHRWGALSSGDVVTVRLQQRRCVFVHIEIQGHGGTWCWLWSREWRCIPEQPWCLWWRAGLSEARKSRCDLQNTPQASGKIRTKSERHYQPRNDLIFLQRIVFANSQNKQTENMPSLVCTLAHTQACVHPLSSPLRF